MWWFLCVICLYAWDCISKLLVLEDFDRRNGLKDCVQHEVIFTWFTRYSFNLLIAEKWIYIFQSWGKNIGSNTSTHTVPTSVRKATTFLQDEYLKEILAASDESYFYFKVQCHHSFRKNDPPHNLKVALCIVSGKVNCTHFRHPTDEQLQHRCIF